MPSDQKEYKYFFAIPYLLFRGDTGIDLDSNDDLLKELHVVL